MRVCVDTTILLDILKDEFRSFQDKLYSALEKKENLVAPSVVFAELMPQFRGDTKPKIPHCGRKLNLKEHFLSDFYIGGFAATRCDAILTRDRGIYTKYFPSLAGYQECLKVSTR